MSTDNIQTFDDTMHEKMASLNEALDNLPVTPSPMQTFVGTKLVKAKPMTRGDYNILRHWDLPADEDGADAGYLVEYLDGGAPNHHDFEGYISWSPAMVFEQSYVGLGDVSDLEPYQVRVAAEQAELVVRGERLIEFLESERFQELDVAEKTRLVMQHTIMRQYADILQQRINAFRSPNGL